MARTYPRPSSEIQRHRPQNNDAPADPDPDPEADPSSDSDSDNVVLAQPPKAPPRGRSRKKTAANEAAPHSKSTKHKRHIRDREATVEQQQGEAFASTIARHLSRQEIDEAATLEAYRSAWEAMRPADSMVSALDKFITKDIGTRLDQVVASRARKCNTSDPSWRKIQTCLNNPPWNLLKIHLYAIFGEDCLARSFLPLVRELSVLKRAEDGESLSLDEAFPVLSQKRDQRRSGLARVKGVEQEPRWQGWEVKQTIEHFVQKGWVERIKAPMQGGKKKKQQDQHRPNAHEKDSGIESLREHVVALLNKDGSGPDSEADHADAEIGSVRSGDGAAEHVNFYPPHRSTSTNGSESEVSHASQADNEEIATATDGADDEDISTSSHVPQSTHRRVIPVLEDDESVVLESTGLSQILNDGRHVSDHEGQHDDSEVDDDEREIEQARRAPRQSSLHEVADDTDANLSFESATWEANLGGAGTSLVSRDSSFFYKNTNNSNHFDDTSLLVFPSPAQHDTTPAPVPRDTRAIEPDNTTAFAAAAATPSAVSKSRLPPTTTSVMADDDASASRKRPRTDELIRYPPLGRDLRAQMQVGLTPALRDELLPGLRACFDIFSVASPSPSQTAEPTPNDNAEDPLAPCRLDAPDGSSYIAFMCGMCLAHLPPTPDPATDHPQATIYLPLANPQPERDQILHIFSHTTGITGVDPEHVRLEELGPGSEEDKQIFVVAAKALRSAYPNANASQVLVQQDVLPSVWRRFLQLCIRPNRVASRLSSESFMEPILTFPAVDLASAIPAGEGAGSPLAAQAATADIVTLQRMEASRDDIEKLVAASEEIRKIVITRLGHVDKEAAPSASDAQEIQQIENLLNCTQDESLRTNLLKRVDQLNNSAKASHDSRKTTLQRLKSALGEDKTDYIDARDALPVKVQAMKEELVGAWREALRRVEGACSMGQAEN